MKKINLLFLSLIISFCTVSASEKPQDIWRQVAPNNYIDPEGIVGTTDIYGFTFLLKAYNKGQYEPINGKKILYTLSQYTIDCVKQTYKIGVMDSYGQNDEFITGDYNRFATFQPIISGTAVSAVAQKLCKP